MTAPTLEVRVRKAARALGRHRLAHAYGHVSARIDAGTFLVCAAQPMGLIAPGTPGTVVRIDGELPEGVLGEVRIHREIYRRRPEIQGVARTMPPKIMSLSTLRLTPKPRQGFGSFFILLFRYGIIPFSSATIQRPNNWLSAWTMGSAS